ncbi:hypothetical protein DSO57_1011777 [Entomophthora muscae]|uniref:Uncharacterized protein n=1 Tax=Entomophthora muscae TaxID=34485 RepID=A0ACC2THK7_9FUNG|nr:hypothetical protein DSO57_1011777 [Entomophthora muscae]
MLFWIIGVVLCVYSQGSAMCGMDDILVRRNVVNWNQSELKSYTEAFYSLQKYQTPLGGTIKGYADLVSGAPQSRDYRFMTAWLRVFLFCVESELKNVDAKVKTVPFCDFSDAHAYIRSQERGIDDKLRFGAPRCLVRRSYISLLSRVLSISTASFRYSWRISSSYIQAWLFGTTIVTSAFTASSPSSTSC